MSFHLEVLRNAQVSVLRRLAPVASGQGFYLAGGTALAILLGHRRSVDLDWFTESPIADPMELAQYVRYSGIRFRTSEIAAGTLHGTVSGVRVSFLEYRYPLLKPTMSWTEMDCRLASLEDIACMKLSALAQRGAKKDYIDIYALGQEIHPLSRMLSLYRRKYRTSDIGHVVYALSYFDQADHQRTPRMIWPVTWSAMKKRIVSRVREIVDEEQIHSGEDIL